MIEQFLFESITNEAKGQPIIYTDKTYIHPSDTHSHCNTYFGGPAAVLFWAGNENWFTPNIALVFKPC
jgi:hypothetical protein